jgi:hypothetical protein
MAKISFDMLMNNWMSASLQDAEEGHLTGEELKEEIEFLDAALGDSAAAATTTVPIDDDDDDEEEE